MLNSRKASFKAALDSDCGSTKEIEDSSSFFSDVLKI